MASVGYFPAFLCGVFTFYINFSASYTVAPVIGILSQETYSVNKYFDEQYTSFIAASYVKFVESAGGRVIPIWIGQNESYYRKVVERTNGILLPGGATWFNDSNGYGDAGQILYDIALEFNKKGDYYPILGICLGMQLLAQVAIGGKEIRAHCSANKLPLPLEFKKDYNQSKLFYAVDEDIASILSTQNVTMNIHRYCHTEANFTEFGLDADWKVISTNKDKNGLEFISVFESKTYPFYGLQFHPEKNLFEFQLNSDIPHGKNATIVSQYFADFFLEEARKNNHSFYSLDELRNTLIYNYNPLYTGKLNSSYEQLYMFKTEDFADVGVIPEASRIDKGNLVIANRALMLVAIIVSLEITL